MIYTSISIGSHWQIISKRTQIGLNLMTNLYLVSNSQDNLSLRDPGFIVEADDELGARFPRRGFSSTTRLSVSLSSSLPSSPTKG